MYKQLLCFTVHKGLLYRLFSDSEMGVKKAYFIENHQYFVTLKKRMTL